MNRLPEPDFAHLEHMSDARGTFEHARFAEPRPSHGYCTDDMARVLLVAAREPQPTAPVRHLVELSLEFLADAHGPGGFRNRLDARGRWEDRPTTEDCWGRSIWGLGTAAAHGHDASIRAFAVVQFDQAVRLRSAWPRSTAFAALGAAELLTVMPDHRGARSLLADASVVLATPRDDPQWPWPEARLRYANALVPEVMIAIGVALDRGDLLRDGLGLLAWLLAHETVGGHLSVTPAGGAGPGDHRPGFDQQPIEVAALADACTRAAAVDRDRRWTDGIAAAAAWFLGDNDSKTMMFDPETGGAFDGLEPGGPNLNQGTESTLALLSTLQQARRFATVAT